MRYDASMSTEPVRVPYRLKADSVEACSCKHGCNCQFAGVPTEGICEFVIGYHVKEGAFGDVPLAGVRAVIAAKYPGAIHEGNGQVVLFVDSAASQAQADAVATILSGKMGGMPWEALAGTVSRFEGPVRKPVEIELAGERSRVRVAGEIEMALTPLRNPVTGEEKEVHITYPKGGFFWDDAAVATTSEMRVRHTGLEMEWPERYAAAAEVNWSNQ